MDTLPEAESANEKVVALRAKYASLSQIYQASETGNDNLILLV